MRHYLHRSNVGSWKTSMCSQWLCVLLLCAGAASISAQNNPFEIIGNSALEMEETLESSTANPFELVLPSSRRPAIDKSDLSFNNPFEIKPLAAVSTVIRAQQTASRAERFAALQRGKSFHHFWLFIGLLFLLTMLVAAFRSAIAQLYRAIFNSSYARMLQRRASPAWPVAFWLYYLFYVLSMGTFLYYSLIHFFPDLNPTLSLWMLSIAVIACVATAKHILLALVGSIFNLGAFTAMYHFLIMLFNVALGIMLFPVVSVLSMASSSVNKYTIILGIVVVVSVYVMRTIRVFFSASSYLSRYPFHFFMYLCTIEIAPMAFFIKWLLNTLVSL